MPNSLREQVVDGEGIYLLGGANEEEKASHFWGVSITHRADSRVVKPQTEEDAPANSHLRTTQQILDLLDEKLQSPLLAPLSGSLDRNNNPSTKSNTSTSELDSKRSCKLKLTRNRRRRCSAQELKNLDYYLDHVIKDSGNCSCRFERSCRQEQINHQVHIGNSWRYGSCCNLSRSEASIAVTLDESAGSLGAQLTNNNDVDEYRGNVVSVNSLTSHSWKGCCCRLGEGLIIDRVSGGEPKHYGCERRRAERDCFDKYHHCNNSSLLESTSNKLLSTCPPCDTPEPYLHNPAFSFCYQSSLEPVEHQRSNAELTIHDKSNREGSYDEESVDEEGKYLATLEARTKFDLVSEVGSALERLPDSELEATTISPTNLLPPQCLQYSSFVGQHNLQLPSTEEASGVEHLDYCSAELKSSGETSLSCLQGETPIPLPDACLCVKCTNGNTSLIKRENCSSGLSSRVQRRGLQSTSTNYTPLNDPNRGRRENIYELIKKNNSYEDIDTSVDDAEEVARSSLYATVSPNEFSQSDISISISDLSLNLSDGRSMRALKEIAKTSVPSISSLQHLPNRIESSKLKRTNSTGTTMEPNLKKNTKSTTNTPPVNVSRESIHHESHLLNRLCLCNCMMKTSNVDSNDESLKKRANLECASTDIKSASNCLSSSSNSLRNTSSKQTSAREGDDNSLLKSSEKQSPAFLNLLLKSAVELKNGPFSLKQRTVSPSNHHQHQASTDDISSILSGASGDFYSSSSSLSGGLKRRHLKSESSLLLSEQRASQAFTSASSDKRQDADSRPKSECSNVERTQRHVSATRYLSLSRLFSGKKSSKTSSEVRKDAKITAEPVNVSSDEPPKSCDQENKSFLTKSLQRLSYRRRNNKSSHTNQSPSSSSSSPYQSPLEYSTDSGQKIKNASISSSPVKSAQSQILVAPEIAINHVQYCNISNTPEIRSRTTTDSMESSIVDTESFCRTQSDLYDYNESTRGGLLVSDTDEGSFSLSSTPNYLHNNHLAATPQNPKRSPQLSRSPVSFESPASHSSKIEDGLKVCSTEHFEKHIDNIKDTQIEAQKKLFKLWINYYCPNLIRSDLVLELKDGIKLIGLIASLTHDKQLLSTYSRLNRDRQTYINRIVTTPSSRLRHLSNVSMAINFLREKVGMKLINLNPMDIVSGKPNVILGLCWNIILNFQLEQNFPKCGHSKEHLNDSGTDTSLSSSNGLTKRRYSKKENLSCVDEYTPGYFLNAKKKVLDHINKRFNLKLTTLTSNLINGDVLLTILRQLSPEVACMEVIRGQGEQVWESMSNEDKLDCCFALAQAHLSIPCLFSARDLMRHHLDHNNFKPLLVYLSMLLSASPSDLVNSQTPVDLINVEVEPDMNGFIQSYLDDIETSDKFHLAKLHFTIEKLKKLRDIIEAHRKESDKPELESTLIDRYTKLEEQIKQVENLISWINEADNLIENTNSIPEDLKDSIDKYKDFFSESNIPSVTDDICPILMRQYRECLSNAKQKILSMEQTYKNWNSYQTTSDKLKQWLALAELKLKEASSESTRVTEEGSIPVQHLTDLMQGLIDYFELEPMNNIMSEELSCGNYDLMMNEDTISMTGSIASLNSNSSKILAFQNSPRATSTKLFEEFEIKTHLLATVLEPNQRENLLLAMKQLKRTLKYITKIQVPKVVNELRWSIIQLDSEMQLGEKLDNDVAVLIEDEILEPDVEGMLPSEVIEQTATSDIIEPIIESTDCREDLVNCRKVKVEVVKNEKKSKQVKSRNSTKKSRDKVVVKEDEEVVVKGKAWSFGSWMFGHKEPEVECQTKAAQTNCNTGQAKDTKIIIKNEANLSYPQLYWRVCVVPLINKNICCDFKLEHIPHENLDIGEKPT